MKCWTSHLCIENLICVLSMYDVRVFHVTSDAYTMHFDTLAIVSQDPYTIHQDT